MAHTDQESAYALLWKKIRPVKFAMLTCEDAHGDLTSRPMTTVQDEFSGSLWFFTSRESPVVKSLPASSAVNVSYSEPKDDLYVSLSGRAVIDSSHARREQLWSVMVKAYFPKGIDDPDLVLLRVDVHGAEYWDVTESKAVQLFKLTKAIVSGERPEHLGEHANLEL
jgi:general stress protein 26